MKRPLYTAAAAWMLGELFAENMKYLPLIPVVAVLAALAGGMAGKRKDYICAEILIILVFLFSGMHAVTELRMKYRDYDSVEEGSILLAEGKVKSVSEGNYGYKVILAADKVSFADTGCPLPEGVNLLIEFSGQPELRIGNRISVKGSRKSFYISRNEGNFDEKEYCYGQKIAVKLKGAEYAVTDHRYSEAGEKLADIRQLLCKNIDSCCGEKEASVLKAIIFGDKTELDGETEELYVKNGIAHILAVSGLHMSIVGLGVYRLLRKRFSFFNSGVIGGLILVGFGCMTGFGISVKRAVYMMILRMTADICGRKYDFKSAVSFSMLLILVQNPYAIYNASFLLSYSAMLSLGFIYPEFELGFGIQKGKRKEKYLRYFMPAVSGFLMWLVNLPVIACFYYEIPTYAVFLNFIIIPMMSVLFLSGMAASLVMLVSLRAGVFLSGAGVLIVKLYTFLCRGIEKLPYASVVTRKPDRAKMILFYGILLLLIAVMRYYKKDNRKKFFLAVFFFTVQIYVFYRNFPGDSLHISMIDVGQGECILVENENGHTYLVDAGSSSVNNPAEYQIVPYLKCRGTGRLDYVFVSHGDSDHISGILEMMKEDEIEIRTLVLPDCGQFAGEYAELEALAREKNIKLLYVQQGSAIRDGSLSFEIISPGDKQYRDINDASMVMLLKYQEFSMYFTGDISAVTERELLPQIRAAEVIKVPHHGSKMSSSRELLEKISPRLALVSCGADNLYGHPHSETVERYRAFGTELFATSESGCIEIEVPEKKKGKTYYVSTFLQD